MDAASANLAVSVALGAVATLAYAAVVLISWERQSEDAE